VRYGHWSIEDDEHSIWLYMPSGLVRIGRSELDAWAPIQRELFKPQSSTQPMV